MEGALSIKSLEIKCKELEIDDECFVNNSSLNFIHFDVENSISITDKKFTGCDSIIAIEIYCHSELIVQSFFANGSNELKSRHVIAKNL